MHICNCCGRKKEASDFPPRKSKLSGLDGTCRECHAKKSKVYYSRNKSKIPNRANYKKEWYQKNKERILTSSKERYLSNIQEIKEYQKDYREKNKHKVCAWRQAYKASKLLAKPSWANDKEIYNIYKACNELNRDSINFHVDHIVPLQSNIVCGLHVEYNLQILPANLNLSKKNRYWPDMPGV